MTCKRFLVKRSCAESTVLPGTLKVLPEVEAALRQGQAVVALESTIISHGETWFAIDLAWGGLDRRR